MANVSIYTRTKNPWANVSFEDNTFVKLEIKNKKTDLFGSCSKERYNEALFLLDQTQKELSTNSISTQELIKRVAERWDIAFNNSQKPLNICDRPLI